MLVERYRKEFCLPPNPKAKHLRCYAHLDGDIGEALPYLNTVLGGYQYYKEPPMLTLKFQAKLITLYPQMIAINMVKDEAEAEKILEWLKEEINNTWENRSSNRVSKFPQDLRSSMSLNCCPRTIVKNAVFLLAWYLPSK